MFMRYKSWKKNYLEIPKERGKKKKKETKKKKNKEREKVVLTS